MQLCSIAVYVVKMSVQIGYLRKNAVLFALNVRQFLKKARQIIKHTLDVGMPHTLKEIIGTKIISRRFWEIVAEQYYTYLKTKTKLNFSKALDVGALYGHFVSKLNQNGIDTMGLEADRSYLRSTVTDKVQWGYFDETYNTATKYDLICFTQMLYYVKNPMATLAHAKNMLKDGLIFISTQNPSSDIIKNKKFHKSLKVE